MLLKKVCKQCEEFFETPNPRRETCSTKCRLMFSHEQNLTIPRRLPTINGVRGKVLNVKVNKEEFEEWKGKQLIK